MQRDPLIPVLSDADLIARVREGNREAFESIVLKYATGMVRIAYGYLKSRADAEDLVQDIFLSIWRARASWQPHGAIGAYLNIAVRRRAFNVLQHRRVESSYLDGVSAQTIPALVNSTHNADDAIIAEEDRTAVQQLIDQLSDRSRNALMLRYTQHMSFSDVAMILGISVPAAKKLVGRALDQLRRLYGI